MTMNLPDSLPTSERAVLRQWIQWMTAGDMSETTISERVRYVLAVAERTGAEPTTLTVDHMLDALANASSRNTRATYTYHLKSWSRFLVLMEHRDDDPTMKLPKARTARGLPRPISDADLQRVLQSNVRRRTHAMIVLAAYQGFRAHEIASTHGRAVDLRNGTITVHGKGNKTVTLPIAAEVAVLAKTMPRDDWWFPNHTANKQFAAGAGHVLANSVSRLVSDALRRAGVDGSAHQLRHWFATTLLKTGSDLRTVQELMRHDSLATTAIYTGVDDAQRRAALSRLSAHDLDSPNTLPPLRAVG